jgi:hypothetical protein
MKKLYKITAYSVVYARDVLEARNSLENVSVYDGLYIPKEQIYQITDKEDLPEGWSLLQSAIDSDRISCNCPFTTDCIDTLLSEQTALTHPSVVNKIEELTSLVEELRNKLNNYEKTI